jgi:hypothetical protein
MSKMLDIYTEERRLRTDIEKRLGSGRRFHGRAAQGKAKTINNDRHGWMHALIRQRASAHTWSLERRHDLVDPVKHARFVDHLERGLALTSHDRVIRHLPPAVGSATVKRGQDHCGANMHAMGVQRVCERECMYDNRTWARHTRKGAQ